MRGQDVTWCIMTIIVREQVGLRRAYSETLHYAYNNKIDQTKQAVSRCCFLTPKVRNSVCILQTAIDQKSIYSVNRLFSPSIYSSKIPTLRFTRAIQPWTFYSLTSLICNSGCLEATKLLGGTSSVRNTFPPTVESGPMVISPRMVLLA